MKDKDIISKLHNLSQIKPNSEWQARSREILLSQVSRGVEVRPAHWFDFFESTVMQRFFLELTRPVSIMAAVILVVMGGGLASLKAANQTKPGDPLYIAKIISERTQLAMTFDNNKKTKLNLEFATNRIEELQKVTTAPDVQKASVDELTNEFKAQIAEVKTRIAKMPASAVAEDKTNADNALASDTKKSEVGGKAKVESASAERTNKGIEYYDPRTEMLADLEKQFDQKNYQQSAATLQTLKDVIDKPVEEKKATTTDKKPEMLQKSTSTVEDLR